jgi:hypothetical protein
VVGAAPVDEEGDRSSGRTAAAALIP